MEKEEYKKVEKQECIHHFYCDCCEKHLGSSEEYEDGYYERFGVYHKHFFLDGVGWLNLDKCLCEECAEKFDAKILECLKELGFEEENK